MPAIASRVRVFHAEQFKVLLPVRTLFVEWRRAETGFNPVRGAVIADPSLLHVVNIFIAGNGAATERSIRNGIAQSLLPSTLHASFDQVTHGQR